MIAYISGFRAKDHARYSMVCKKWKVQLTLLCAPTLSQSAAQELEDEHWDEHFAPRAS